MKSLGSQLGFLASQIKEKAFGLLGSPEKLDEIKINQGLILALMQRDIRSRNLQEYEFKVFSQWGEDGIIQYLTRTLEIKNKSFIEFGVESFLEANCRFLMMKDNWSGFVIDGSTAKIRRLRNSDFYWKYDINAMAAFVTRENINELLLKSEFDEDIGVLSIDIDGNDYHILKAISGFRPRILICEYNSLFGVERKITVPYDPSFIRIRAHYSNLYWGASLPAITHLAAEKGYALVGTNSVASNAFYVRNDLLTEDIQACAVKDVFALSKIRDSRNARGSLSYLGAAERLSLLRGLQVTNVESGETEFL